MMSSLLKVWFVETGRGLVADWIGLISVFAAIILLVTAAVLYFIGRKYNKKVDQLEEETESLIRRERASEEVITEIENNPKDIREVLPELQWLDLSCNCEDDLSPVVKATKPRKVAKYKKKDLQENTISNLKSICREEGITGYSKLTKDELIEILVKIKEVR